MKTKLYSILVIAAAFASAPAIAQTDCQIDISIANITKGDVVPDAINSKLEGKLMQALGKAGMIGAPYDSRFFVAGRFDDAINDVTGGPSPKNFVKTTLTLYVGDAEEQKIFDSESFELSGVGASEQLAYTKALNKISATNPTLIKFLEGAQRKIIDYYDSHYPEYLSKARQAMAKREFGEALYYATSIPACCKAYPDAHELAMTISSEQINTEGKRLLALAKAAWAADPTATGAAEAHKYLSEIDPAASCAEEAEALSKQMSETTKKQWEFEHVTKYNNAVALEKERIRAAKEVAVAWAKSRPQQVNRYVFIRR